MEKRVLTLALCLSAVLMLGGCGCQKSDAEAVTPSPSPSAGTGTEGDYQANNNGVVDPNGGATDNAPTTPGTPDLPMDGSGNPGGTPDANPGVTPGGDQGMNNGGPADEGMNTTPGASDGSGTEDAGDAVNDLVRNARNAARRLH